MKHLNDLEKKLRQVVPVEIEKGVLLEINGEPILRKDENINLGKSILGSVYVIESKNYALVMGKSLMSCDTSASSYIAGNSLIHPDEEYKKSLKTQGFKFGQIPNDALKAVSNIIRFKFKTMGLFPGKEVIIFEGFDSEKYSLQSKKETRQFLKFTDLEKRLNQNDPIKMSTNYQYKLNGEKVTSITDSLSLGGMILSRLSVLNSENYALVLGFNMQHTTPRHNDFGSCAKWELVSGSKLRSSQNFIEFYEIPSDLKTQAEKLIESKLLTSNSYKEKSIGFFSSYDKSNIELTQE